jgi:hypothetical protein
MGSMASCCLRDDEQQNHSIPRKKLQKTKIEPQMKEFGLYRFRNAELGVDDTRLTSVP